MSAHSLFKKTITKIILFHRVHYYEEKDYNDANRFLNQMFIDPSWQLIMCCKLETTVVPEKQC